MKIVLLASAALVLVLTACDQKTNGSSNQPMAVEENKSIDIKLADLATSKDLYCLMDLEEGALGDTATYEGKIYGFCASECKDSFLAEPTKYLTQK